MNQMPAYGRPRALPTWRRLGAAAVDFVVLLIPEIIAFQLIAGSAMSRALSYYQAHVSQGPSVAVAHSPNYQPALYHFYIATEAITAAYLIATYLGWSATVGKLLFGLRITRVDGHPLRARDAVLRSVPFWLPLLIVPLSVPLLFFEYVGGTILIFARPDHRGPEDLLGGSMVVAKEFQGRSLKELTQLAPPTQPPPQPPPPSSGHLPGWEPVYSPPAANVAPALPEPEGEDTPAKEEERA
ncbi:MAG: RDD family protein [Candidatus Dormibacteraeota bacterium]|nr:RDD family protein [Candidatus Dormibacteraeota bacterium]